MKNVFNFLSFYFKIIHSSSSLFLVLTAVVFSSCTHSLNIMNRKYRPGYSIQYSTNTSHSSKKTTQAEQPQPEPRQDSVALKTMNDDVIVSSDNSQLFLKEYNAVVKKTKYPITLYGWYPCRNFNGSRVRSLFFLVPCVQRLYFRHHFFSKNK